MVPSPPPAALAEGRGTPHSTGILALQQLAGNRAVAGLRARPPHEEDLRRSFGPHYPEGTIAITGPAAVEANTGLGTSGLAAGGAVAFAADPSLELAAHEMAHVVQQRRGLGAASTQDHEEQARRIGEVTARGGSSAPLLDTLRPSQRGTPVVQGDTGLLQPQAADGHGHVDYVRVDVPGDGSCLFHSVLLGSVATALLPELRSRDFRDQTPDMIGARVEQATATVLGVEREHLRAALEDHQWRERELVAQHWLDNPDDFRAALVGDIRSSVLAFLQEAGMAAPIYAHAAVRAAGSVDAHKSPQKPDRMSTEEKDEEAAPGEAETGDSARTASDYLTQVKGRRPTADALRAGETPVDLVHSISADQLSRLGFHKSKPKGLNAYLVDLKNGTPGDLAHNIASRPVGHGVRKGSEFEHQLRMLVITAIGRRHAGGAFTGAEFTDDDLAALIPSYIAEFTSAKVYAGEAAMLALRARHHLDIDSHIYDGPARIQGGDDVVSVKVLETPAHFQVLVGPLPLGHVLPPGAAAPPDHDDDNIAGEQDDFAAMVGDWDEKAGYGSHAENPLGLTRLVLVEGSQGQKDIVAHVDGRGLSAEPWLRRLVDGKHLNSPGLQAMLQIVRKVKQGEECSMTTLMGMAAIAANMNTGGFTELEVTTGLTDVESLLQQGKVVYAPDRLPVTTHLRRVLEGPLKTGLSHVGAALVHDVLQRVEQALTDTDEPLTAVGEQLRRLAEGLRITSLAQARQVRHMEPVYLPFQVFWPSKTEQNRIAGFDRDAFRTEVHRQAALQQRGLNAMTLDHWMVNRDTFNLKVPERQERIIDNRSASHLRSLADTMLVRNDDIGQHMSNRGNTQNKRMRIAFGNQQFDRRFTPKDALDALMRHSHEVRNARQGRVFNPDERLDAAEVTEELHALLRQMQRTGRLDEGDQPITTAMVKDLVGRSNSQSKWKKLNETELKRGVRALRAEWAGLLPPASTDEPLSGLAALHNPDQVAGGERDLPKHPGDVTDHIGPGVVNSALGATWGLPDAASPNLGALAQQLENILLKRYPEESWPLMRMNIVLVVEIGTGTHLIPQPVQTNKKREAAD